VISASLAGPAGPETGSRAGIPAAPTKRRAAPRVVMISQRYWENRLGEAEDAVGSTLRIDGAPATVIGVVAARIPAVVTAATRCWLRCGRERTRGPLPAGRRAAEGG